MGKSVKVTQKIQADYLFMPSSLFAVDEM